MCQYLWGVILMFQAVFNSLGNFLVNPLAGFLEANAVWVATCVGFMSVTMISVNIVARRSADKWREAEEVFKDFEEFESFSTLSRIQD